MEKDNQVALLLSRLKSEDINVVSDALCTLADMGPAALDALPALVLDLNDSDPSVREIAASALGYIGIPDETVIAALMKAIKDEDSNCLTKGESIILSYYEI